MQNADFFFDKAAMQRWGLAYDTYFKGWLPKDKNAIILDVGCGGGRLLYFLKKRGYVNIHGVDVSPEQVKRARQVVGNVTQGDAVEYLHRCPRFFDLIIGIDLVEHYRKDEVIDLLDACCRALRPKGRLILQTPNAESPWGMEYRYGDFTHESAFSPQCLKNLMELVGFIKIEPRCAGPVVHGILSLVRFLVWKIIWFLLVIWNLAEIGDRGSGIYTRVFLISGIKKKG